MPGISISCLTAMFEVYTGWTQKSSSPETFVVISAMRINFCMKFCAAVKQENMHFITQFGGNT